MHRPAILDQIILHQHLILLPFLHPSSFISLHQTHLICCPPLTHRAHRLSTWRHVLFVIWRPPRFTQVPSSRVSDVPTGTCLQASPLPPQTHSDCSLLIPQPPRVPAGLPQPSDRVLEAWDDQTRPRPLQVQTVRAAAQPPPPTLFSNSDHTPMTPSPPPTTGMPHMPVFATVSGFRL